MPTRYCRNAVERLVGQPVPRLLERFLARQHFEPLDLAAAAVRLRDRRVEHAHARAPDVRPRAVAFDERNDRPIRHGQSSVCSRQSHCRSCVCLVPVLLGHVPMRTSRDLHRICGKLCGKVPPSCWIYREFLDDGAVCTNLVRRVHATAHYNERGANDQRSVRRWTVLVKGSTSSTQLSGDATNHERADRVAGLRASARRRSSENTAVRVTTTPSTSFVTIASKLRQHWRGRRWRCLGERPREVAAGVGATSRRAPNVNGSRSGGGKPCGSSRRLAQALDLRGHLRNERRRLIDRGGCVRRQAARERAPRARRPT